MCKMASGFINPRTMDIRVWRLDRHSDTAEHLGITDTDRPDSWREMHYTTDGTVECRILPQDSHNRQECESYVRATWPRFVDFLNWALPQCCDEDGAYNGSLHLSGLTSADGLTLPETVNGSLHLGGLTSADGLTLPETVNGWLYLSGLTSADGLTLPETVNGSLHLSGLTSADGLTLPETVNGWLYLGESVRAELRERGGGT